LPIGDCQLPIETSVAAIKSTIGNRQSAIPNMTSQLALQLFISALIVIGVLIYMWRMPRNGERYFGWAPPLALASVWIGVVAVVLSGVLWWLPYPDRWLTVTFLAIDPAAICAGVLVLWIYRGHEGKLTTITLQILQSRVGITLGLIAVIVGYCYVWQHKTIGSPIGL
jgi:hypothetical protein